MNYMTTTRAGEKWGLTQSRVLKLAQGGRIPGAVQIGYRWMIPENAEKPQDARTKKGKVEALAVGDGFRFPIFDHRDIDHFVPPLCEEELRMKAVSEAFHACRFEESNRILGDLPETAKDKYHRICFLYAGCMVDIVLCNGERFLKRYGRLWAELQDDFPHKTELTGYLYELDALLGISRNCTIPYSIDLGYQYHESFLPHLANLCSISLSYAGEKPSAPELKAHELNCILLENSDSLVDLQSIHLYLCCAYVMLGMQGEAVLHLKKVLDLAARYEMFFLPAGHFYYFQKPLACVFECFPKELKDTIETLGQEIHQRYVRFMDMTSLNSFFKLLEENDYIYVYYTIQDMSNKEIAQKLHVSVGTVSKRLSKIYATLGVKNKAEMVELYRNSFAETGMACSPVALKK